MAPALLEIRTQSAVPVAPAKPEPAQPQAVPAADVQPASTGLYTDWVALVIWLAGAVIIGTLLLQDLVLALLPW